MENGEDSVLTYAEAFPPLAAMTTPSSSNTSVTTSSSQKKKNKKPKTATTQQTHAIPTSTITQIFHVAIEERRYKSKITPFGTENSQMTAVREIMSKTGCKIETSESKDQSLTIMVTGKPSAVKDAHRYIKTQLQTKVVYEVSIPKEHHGFVLGKQGAKLKQIEQNTNTKIAVPKPDEKSDVIKITGNREDADLARVEIKAISEELFKNHRQDVNIPCEYQPFISGPNGAVAAEIMSKYDVKINMPPVQLKKEAITIVGEKDNVAKAKDRILQLYKAAKSNCTTVSVEIKKTQHKYVTQKGLGINEILAETGVFVEVPMATSETETITLRGPQEMMGKALTLVYGKANSMVTEEVVAPAWLHRFIIGRKGENIKNITRDLPHVTVTFPRDDGDVIAIEGPPDEVKHAKEQFENFTEGLMATMVYAEVSVPQKFHPHIIGRRGANINKIKEETCTSISIPSDKEKSDIIRIEGDPQGVAAAKKIIGDMAAKLKNELSEEVSIEQKWHKLIIGANGEKMKEINDRYPGVRIAFPEQGRRSNTVTLRGPSEEVKQCKNYMEKHAKDVIESNCRGEVRISKKFHGTVIGKGGVTLRKLKEETNTRIEMPKEDSDSDIITIVGRKENVEKAKKKLHEIEKQVASIVDSVVRIPHKQHNAIIGPKGKLIRSVMDDCSGVRIHFPSGDSVSDEVHIHGPKEEVAKARSMLTDIANKHAEENYTVEITCKPEYHRFLIGRGGAKIRRVRDEFDARIIFPQKESDDESDQILIIGRKENVEKAKDHLRKLIKDLENIVTEEIEVDQKHHRHFIQRRGQLIQDISEDNGGVIISFPKVGSDSNKVLLKGAKQCIEGAKTAIEEAVEDLEAQVVVKCIIPHESHREIMGPKGSNVQAVTQEYNVSIKFPEKEPSSNNRRNKVEPTSSLPMTNGIANGEDEGKDQNGEESVESPRDTIIIMGRKENCEKAQKALMELVPVRLSVPVPFEFHRFIIGARGQDVRSMADKFGVSIEVPAPELQEDAISVHGPAQNCESAKLALEVRVQELEAEKEERELRSYKEVLSVDSKYHPNIIGKRGATINKIRDDYDVRIQLPDKDQDGAKDIVVIGYEHQVQVAKEALMKIVRELEEQITEDVEIDHRVHSRLIGAKGKAIGKVMDNYKVVVKFPKDKSSDVVSISGLEENVEEAKEHLILLAEDYMQDVIERQEEEELRSQYTRNSSQEERRNNSGTSKGFMVSGAPWSGESGSEEFPSITNSSPTPPTTKTPLWGPSSTGPKIPKAV